jgi:hypothetical protein
VSLAESARGAFVLVVWIGLSTLALGCGRSAVFDGTEYRDDRVAFRLGKVPDGSDRIQASDALVAFERPEIGATIAVSARCHRESDDIPLRALVAHLFLQLTDRQTLGERQFELDGREALEVEVTAKLDGVARHFIVTVLKKDGCVYDMWHIDRGGQAPELLDARADFRTMVRGFRALPVDRR